MCFKITPNSNSNISVNVSYTFWVEFLSIFSESSSLILISSVSSVGGGSRERHVAAAPGANGLGRQALTGEEVLTFLAGLIVESLVLYPLSSLAVLYIQELHRDTNIILYDKNYQKHFCELC